jgi:hypothetical protein
MSLLLNLGNSITAGTDPYQFYNFRERVLADGATVLSDTQVSEEIKRLRSLGLYSKFSALYTPAVRNTSKLYSIISADGDATVTRGSVKNINSVTGTLEEIASDVTPSSFGTGGWGALVEGARTNLALRSEEFGTTWIRERTNLTLNNATAPNGTQTADELIVDTNTNSHAITQTVSVVSGTSYTLSVFAKKSTQDFIQLTHGGGAFSALPFANFDLNNGVVGATGGSAVARIENYGNGWYRCIMTATATATATSSTFFNIVTNASATRFQSYTGNGTDSIFIWGAQLEAGSFASSYMKTEGATFTRSADVITKTGASDLIGQTEGTLFAVVTRVNAQFRNSGRLLSINDGDADFDNRFEIGNAGAGISERIVVLMVSGGVTQFLYTTPNSITGTPKVCVVYSSGQAKFYINGALITTQSYTSLPPNMQRIGIGSYANTSTPGLLGIDSSLDDRILLAGISKTALTQAEAIALTT